MNWRDILWSVAILTTAVLLGLLVHRVGFAIARRIAGRTTNRIDQSVVRYAYTPARLILPLFALLLALPVFVCLKPSWSHLGISCPSR